MIYAENEILGNIKCLLMSGCLLFVGLLMLSSTVLPLFLAAVEPAKRIRIPKRKIGDVSMLTTKSVLSSQLKL